MSLISCVSSGLSQTSPKPHFLHPHGRASRIQPPGSRRLCGPASLRHFTVYQRHLEQQAVEADRRPRRWKGTSGGSSGRRGEPDGVGRQLNTRRQILLQGKAVFLLIRIDQDEERERKVLPSNVNLCDSHVSVDLKSGCPQRMLPLLYQCEGV